MQTSLVYARFLVAGLLTVLLVGLNGCGFHLRGDIRLAPELGKVYFRGGDPYHPLVRDWTRALETAGARVVDAPQDATAVVQILQNRADRRVLSVRSTGRVQEYELYQTLEFRVLDAAGQELLPAQRFELTRDYLFDPNDVLGKTGEEQSLRRDMYRDLVRLAMLRLESLGH